MTITEERQKNVNFSEPYYAATQALLVRSENAAAYTSLDVLKGKKIAVQLGTTGDGAAKKLTDEGKVVQFQTVFEAVMELNNKKVDAAIIDEQPAKVLLAKNTDLVQATVTFPAEYYGIASKKGNDELTAAVNKTLARMKADGSYDKLVGEWIK
jgi:polar amino acid transport system substrate-binding protein